MDWEEWGNENGKVWEEWGGGAPGRPGRHWGRLIDTHSYPYYLLRKEIIVVILEGTLPQGPGVFRAGENRAPIKMGRERSGRNK